MKNLWYPEITEDLILDLKKKYNDILNNTNKNDARITRFYNDFTNSYIYNSNAIEGNPITEFDTYIILNSNSFLENYTQTENQEVVSLNKAFKYVLTKPLFNIDTMLQIHQHILYFDNVNAGKYRTSMVNVGDKNMLDPSEIKEAIEKLFNRSLLTNFFENISKFHLDFENIHPFIDGNGRTGRLLLNLSLIQNDYLPINIKYTDRIKYYRAFRKYDQIPDKGINELYSLVTKAEFDELNSFISMFE